MRFSMKYWKIMAYFGSIALAVGIGVFTTTVREKNIVERTHGKALCNYTGFSILDCNNSTFTTGCNSGTFKAADMVDEKDEGKGDFRKVIPNTYNTQGKCVGNTSCVTPTYPNLTSTGCGG